MTAQQHPLPPPDGKAPPQGLTATFLRIGGRLRCMATQLLGNEAEADDALYEAFARLWQRGGEQMQQTAQEQEALLITTVRHLSIDQLRERQRHRTTSMDEPEAAPLASASTSEEEEDIFPQVEALIALHLSPLQQHVLYRRDRDGVAYADIAQELGMQETAVRMQLSRARRTIREIYQQQCQRL